MKKMAGSMSRFFSLGRGVSSPCTLHPAPYTLNATPCTLHAKLYTLHSTPSTLNPTLCTLNSQLFNLHSDEGAGGTEAGEDEEDCGEHVALLQLPHDEPSRGLIFIKSQLPHKTVN